MRKNKKSTAIFVLAVLFFILAVLCHDIVLYLPRVFMINKTKNMKYMKENYEAPLVQVIEMEVQGMLAQSPGTEGSRGGYPSGGDWSNG